MDFTELEAFICIARSKSISKAAAALRVSQPAISQRLKSLEQAVGGPAFLRTSRGMELTPAGAALLPFAERITELFSEGLATAGGEVGRSRVVMATVESVACILAAGFLDDLRRLSPDLEVSMVTAYSYQVFQMVMDGSAHVGFVLGHDSYPGLKRVEIVKEPVRFYARPDHPLLLSPGCTLADLAPYSVALSPWGTDWRDQFGPLLTLTDGKVKFWDVSPALVVKQLVEKGWVGLMSCFHAAQEVAEGRFKELLVSNLPHIEFTVSVVLRERKTLDEGVRRFLRCLVAHFPQSTRSFPHVAPAEKNQTA